MSSVTNVKHCQKQKRISTKHSSPSLLAHKSAVAYSDSSGDVQHHKKKPGVASKKNCAAVTAIPSPTSTGGIIDLDDGSDGNTMPTTSVKIAKLPRKPNSRSTSNTTLVSNTDNAQSLHSSSNKSKQNDYYMNAEHQHHHYNAGFNNRHYHSHSHGTDNDRAHKTAQLLTDRFLLFGTRIITRVILENTNLFVITLHLTIGTVTVIEEIMTGLLRTV